MDRWRARVRKRNIPSEDIRKEANIKGGKRQKVKQKVRDVVGDLRKRFKGHEKKPDPKATPAAAIPYLKVPNSDRPTTTGPKSEGPTSEGPATEVPTSEVSATRTPVLEIPDAGAIAPEGPTTRAIAPEVPTTRGLIPEAPATRAPALDIPAAGVPAPEVPVTITTSHAQATIIQTQQPASGPNPTQAVTTATTTSSSTTTRKTTTASADINATAATTSSTKTQTTTQQTETTQQTKTTRQTETTASPPSSSSSYPSSIPPEFVAWQLRLMAEGGGRRSTTTEGTGPYRPATQPSRSSYYRSSTYPRQQNHVPEMRSPPVYAAQYSHGSSSNYRSLHGEAKEFQDEVKRKVDERIVRDSIIGAVDDYVMAKILRDNTQG